MNYMTFKKAPLHNKTFSRLPVYFALVYAFFVVFPIISTAKEISAKQLQDLRAGLYTRYSNYIRSVEVDQCRIVIKFTKPQGCDKNRQRKTIVDVIDMKQVSLIKLEESKNSKNIEMISFYMKTFDYQRRNRLDAVFAKVKSEAKQRYGTSNDAEARKSRRAFIQAKMVEAREAEGLNSRRTETLCDGTVKQTFSELSKSIGYYKHHAPRFIAFKKKMEKLRDTCK